MLAVGVEWPPRKPQSATGRREKVPPRADLSGDERTSSLVAYFALTFLVTWSAFALAATFAPRGAVSPAGEALVRELIFHIGVFAPGLVAITLTGRAGGRVGARAWLARLFHWRAGVRWYVFAVAFPPAVKLGAAILHGLFLGEWPPFGGPSVYLIPAAIFLSMWVQAGEEVGWRGYALPRMATRMGLGVAAILLGAIWAAWHLPLFFFFPAADTAGQSFPLYLTQVMAISIIMAWLFWRTKGSLVVVMLIHATFNNTHDLVPSRVQGATDPLAISTSPVAWLTALLLWLPAAYFLWRMRGVRSPYEGPPAS